MREFGDNYLSKRENECNKAIIQARDLASLTSSPSQMINSLQDQITASELRKSKEQSRIDARKGEIETEIGVDRGVER